MIKKDDETIVTTKDIRLLFEALIGLGVITVCGFVVLAFIMSINVN